jgi:hypothetical protein
MNEKKKHTHNSHNKNYYLLYPKEIKGGILRKYNLCGLPTVVKMKQEGAAWINMKETRNTEFWWCPLQKAKQEDQNEDWPKHKCGRYEHDVN